MTREQFLNFVRQPDLVASYSADELQKLVDQFPYCQPLRILQLRHLKDNDSIQYSQKLKVTAAFAPDRVRLYQLMHNISPDSTSTISTPAPEYISATNDVVAEEIEAPATPELTPQEIVENRLKELNLWKEDEPEAQSPAITIEAAENNDIREAILEEEEHDPLEDLIKEAIVETQIKESDYFTEIGISDDVDNHRAISLDHEIRSLEHEIKVVEHKIFEVEEQLTADEAELASGGDTDDGYLITERPLAPAIYNEEEEEETTPAAPVEVHQAAMPTATVTPAEVPPATTPIPPSVKANEAHSFAEWLQLNHPHDEPSSAPKAEPAAAKITPKAEAPEVNQNTIAPAPTHEAPVYDQPAAYAIEANDQAQEEEQASSNEPIADIPARPTAKVLYVKGGNKTPDVPPPAKPIVVTPSAAPTPTPRMPSTPSLSDASAFSYPTGPTTPAGQSDSSEGRSEIPGPTLRTNRELGLKEVIKPSKKGKKNTRSESQSQAPSKPAPGKNEQIKIIEQFIQQEPRITPMKAYNNPVNMARKSVQESDELVTETLAAIYAQQGNFEKAISFYEKLSLKIPEKSAYFAALIKDLKNKLNS